MIRLFSLISITLLFNSSLKSQTFRIADTSFGVGEVYTSWKIVFELGHGKLLVDASQPTLDSIHKFLLDYPNTVVEIGVHTDFRGKKSDNEKLSQLRADALKNYFTGTLITENRLVSKGYGSSRPIITEEETRHSMSSHQYNGPGNRRVTITILKK